MSVVFSNAEGIAGDFKQNDEHVLHTLRVNANKMMDLALYNLRVNANKVQNMAYIQCVTVTKVRNITYID
jgi:hypothetical protein